MKKSELINGTHFWAKLHHNDNSIDDLVAMIKSGDNYYVCGAWECSCHETEFDIIKIIELPEGYEINLKVL